MPRIALLDDYQNVAMGFGDWGQLPQGWEVTVFNDHLEDEDAVAQRLAPFQIVLIVRERTRFPRTLLEKLPNLRMIANTGMRNASVDFAAATERGILVSGSEPGPKTTIDLTWGLMIGLMRNLHIEFAGMRQGGWQTTLGVALEGKTLGLIGLGAIGGRVAEIARAFRMRVLAWSQNLTDSRADECGVEKVTLEKLLAEADVVSIHTQLSERTRGLLGQKELALMKPTAYLVNTSRGPIVEEQALLQALRKKKIGGAALDVYHREPLPPDDPIRRLDNVLLSPHLGYVAEEVYRIYYGQGLENILAFLAGSPQRVLNPDVLPRLAPPPA